MAFCPRLSAVMALSILSYCFFVCLAAGKYLIVNTIGLFRATGNVGFGSLAAPQHSTSPTAAFGGKADIQNAGKTVFRQAANGHKQWDGLLLP